MNTFMNELKSDANYKLTENCAVAVSSTFNKVYDMFAFGGAYRNRSEADCVLLFKEAFEEDAEMALKCLFYLGDCRGGQGERRLFRVCFNWLAQNFPTIAAKNMVYIPEFRRWDDVIYSCAGTMVEKKAFDFIKTQFLLDLSCKTPSLLGKWLPSENASSADTRRMANKVRNHFGMTHKEYRKALSTLRTRINIVEKLMSENRWEEIEFDKLPSKAGLIYRNAFARRDMIAKKYEDFAKDKNTTVNADTLNPVDIAFKAFRLDHKNYDDIDRISLDKYWNNLKDYYNGREENGLCIVDVSGSMTGTPMAAAVSMGAYIAERGHGPFANHFITFSARPKLVAFKGIDITDKLNRCCDADWGYNTNIEAVFDLLLNTAKKKQVKAEDLPTRLYIFSDMEFDAGLNLGYDGTNRSEEKINTLLEDIAIKWKKEGYELPQVIFWNLDARQNTIPALNGRFAYISGFSMSIIENILSGKDGIDLMKEALLKERYNCITV